MGSTLLLMSIGYVGVEVFRSLRQLALVIYFPLFFFLQSLHNPYHGSYLVQWIAYLCVYLFWTAIFYLITGLWKK